MSDQKELGHSVNGPDVVRVLGGATRSLQDIVAAGKKSKGAVRVTMSAKE